MAKSKRKSFTGEVYSAGVWSFIVAIGIIWGFKVGAIFFVGFLWGALLRDKVFYTGEQY